MSISQMYIAVAIVVLAVVALLLFFVRRKAQCNAIDPVGRDGLWVHHRGGSSLGRTNSSAMG